MSAHDPIWTDGARGPATDKHNAVMDGVHKFERRGLGKAPFSVIGYGREVFQAIPGDPNCPLQPGTSCDYCGTGIMDVAYIRSSDGKEFKVGCDCVAKTGDAGLTRCIKQSKEYRALQRQKRYARHEVVAAEVKRLLADEAVRERLGGYLTQIENSVQWSGMAGYARNLKRIHEVLASA
jgi:hypothetical protein